ncbi:LysR family transcriptional regulator [Streptomyces aidingensis]|uniref:DNA-binding transcriptional regulator, LysR family n=1 Tax=Streptomyces aidingensis TaxID=910347 RepID=A0A1I1KDG2_9ACTN|nr:LysR family transcriptional regulator [Streptomyces aidingensis]SFC58525.1 DNA-binding transcriptional regulator, LysR family [Streptomyces aidingensis]
MDLELRHLKTVRAIADAGSLTKAATALGLPQPALSAQLKRIERTLGGPLFDRGRHGVRLTALGELVLERARVLLPAVRELQEDAVRLARTRDGAAGPARFRLGGTHGPLLGGLVDRIATVFPGHPVSTATSWSEREITGAVRQGRLDYALIGTCGEAPPPDAGRLAWAEVGRDPVFVMLAENHPLAGRTEIGLAELAAASWADVPGDGCFADCFTAACVRAGFSPVTVFETDIAACVHLVRVGRAAGLCRATFPPTPGLVTRPLAGAPLHWRHLLGWHPESPAARTAPRAVAEARLAHAEAAQLNADYRRWLRGHPGFGPALTVPA